MLKMHSGKPRLWKIAEVTKKSQKTTKKRRMILVALFLVAFVFIFYFQHFSTLSKRQCDSNGVFKNWSEEVSQQPTHFHLPESIEALQAIVKSANDKKEPVKVIGANHSWSDIGKAGCQKNNSQAQTHLISLDKINKVLKYELFSEKSWASDDQDHINPPFIGTVTVEAGIRLKHLFEELDTKGYSPLIIGSSKLWLYAENL